VLMKLRILFRTAKFIVYYWTLPFLLGFALSTAHSILLIVEMFEGFDVHFSELLQCAQ